MNKKPEDFLIWQYRGKPKARQTVELLFSESKIVYQSAVKLAEILDIDKSVGYGLDLIGRHVGIGRTMKSFVPKDYFGWLGIAGALGFNNGLFYRYGDSLQKSVRLDDSDYRFFIRAKIIKNFQRPTIEGITHSLQHLLGEYSFVIDNYDMTMNVVVPANYLTPFRLHAILKLDILSRPIGVRYQFVVINSDRPFGWENDSHAFGFGDGQFTRIINVNHQ
ncbi:DUF2612 domain-containing protein [Xenorhabdus griffiniae]|uniref:DUF2612 domain-containing protein n=1 Tax=Xenorhabdus griffiniae TaxID=351672 RepID=A0ABY9XE88_9GAMM|nr:DUF2612 domain-containing protein [Xenorhabdus griffiniae]MBD1228399.1 DUF2612 domain-containing protein [Xenorhabdus griffiniae]MBE8587948.1 DUF2612 domain-containing protein [Xenorhabdus griffiniae]WMV71220.1 DUF2612 domain-containing protein [Xenorhabdus griffiniae]WNH00896.1 DUF2612 domain-containing protein [Xenorhabdus griffiniae]